MNAQEETLRIIAGLATADAPVTLLAASTLPGAGAYMAGIVRTAVPAGKTRALITIAYTHGTGGSATAGDVTARVLVGTAASGSAMYLLAIPSAPGYFYADFSEPGGIISFQIPPGITWISVDLRETGDGAHPGENVSATVNFS